MSRTNQSILYQTHNQCLVLEYARDSEKNEKAADILDRYKDTWEKLKRAYCDNELDQHEEELRKLDLSLREESLDIGLPVAQPLRNNGACPPWEFCPDTGTCGRPCPPGGGS